MLTLVLLLFYADWTLHPLLMYSVVLRDSRGSVDNCATQYMTTKVLFVQILLIILANF